MSTNDGWGPVAPAGVAGLPAAGWYADPWRVAAQRFWDGARWTPHTSGATVAAARPRLQEGTPVYWPSIWLLAVLPAVNVVTPWFLGLDLAPFVEYLQATQDAARAGTTISVPPPDPFEMLGGGYAVVVALGTVLYVVVVALAYRDFTRLARAGVERPFHWAWAFLAPLVYVIGRSVVVRKVAAPRGLAPMWTAIVVSVLVQVSSAIWTVTLVASMTEQLSVLV